METSPDLIICGGGIAGISAAYHLTVRHGLRNVLLCEQDVPLSLTSDKSTECYRNWWPGPGDAMVALMNRSIDLLEELAHASNNVFNLSRRGYLYLTADPAKIPAMRSAAEETSRLGAGPLRIYTGAPDDPLYQPAQAEGFSNEPDGADLILDAQLLHRHFPYLTESAAAALHVRRAGWFSAQQLGAYLLAESRLHGLATRQGRVAAVETANGKVQAVRFQDGSRLPCRGFINAGGPLIQQVGDMLGVELPVYSELHQKASIKDHLGLIPREAPLLIWTDAQKLPWSEAEAAFLQEDPESSWLLEEFPPGVHTRPEGGAGSPIVLMLWEYRTRVLAPVFPIPLDPNYPDIVLRGLATMLPRLRAYFDNPPRPYLDGGYYTKTRENRPLIGPLPVDGAYILGALSGYGLMAACAAGELLAAHVTGAELPAYAAAFSLERYQDPAYLAALAGQVESGQL